MKDYLKEIFKDERKRSLFVLVTWVLLFVIFFFLVGLYNTVNKDSNVKSKEEIEVKETVKELTLEEKFNNLINSDYGFIYLITKDNDVIKYSGVSNKTVVEGYRERQDGIIKYKIENNITYEVKMTEQEEIDTLYENINKDMLDLNYIYKLISNLTANKIKDGDREIYIYDTLLDDSEIKIEIDTNKEKVSKILITLENESYTLEFS